MTVDIIAAQGEGFSISIISQQIKEMFEADGQEVHWELDSAKSFKHAHKNIVICTQPNALIRLLAEPFTMSPRLILSLLLSNWEEHTPWVRKAYLAAVLDGKNSGTPLVTIVHSQHTYDMMVKDARQWFSPSNVQQIAQNLILELFGVGDEFAATGVNAPDRLIVPYNRIVQSQKNLDLHIKLSRQYAVLAAQRGLPVPVHDFLHAPAYDPAKIAEEKEIGTDVYDFRPQFKGRQEMAEGVRQYGMFLSTSMFESFGIYYLELLKSGVVGVFLDRPWVRKLLPNYPYVAKSEDLVPMMLEVRTHYGDAQTELREYVIPEIEKRYSLKRFMARVKHTAYSRARPEKETKE